MTLDPERMVQPTATDTLPPAPEDLHWVRRGEWPIALCGYMVQTPFSTPPSAHGRDVCAECQKIASRMLREGTAWRKI